MHRSVAPDGAVPAVGIAIMTRDRAGDLVHALDRLVGLPEAPPIVVVDNGSGDDTVERVRARFPTVDLVPAGRNLGIEARNRAARRLPTPVVAFNDDDSWWEPGALAAVAAAFAAHPRLGAVAARVVVEPTGEDDPVTTAMAASPLGGDPTLPGAPVLGFLACAVAVRREAFLAVGGFERRLHFAGEEQLLAIDLRAAGWEVRHLPEVVVHHRPAGVRRTRWRARRDTRNRLWCLWLRRPAGRAARLSVAALRAVPAGVALGALADAVGRGGWVLRTRRPAPAWLERQLELIDP
ncbi:MAG TPA: glycosyltransferase [Iamia sp.]|nr:glycosyltransferase [Iamia sp.]